MNWNLNRFKNSFLRKGKKNQSERLYLSVMWRLKKEKEEMESPIQSAIESLRPKIRLVDRKKGGSNLKIPSLIRIEQSWSLAFKWFVRSVKERKERRLEDRIFLELKDILEGKGRSVKKKEDYYKLATHNRGFLRFFRGKRK